MMEIIEQKEVGDQFPFSLFVEILKTRRHCVLRFRSVFSTYVSRYCRATTDMGTNQLMSEGESSSSAMLLKPVQVRI